MTNRQKRLGMLVTMAMALSASAQPATDEPTPTSQPDEVLTEVEQQPAAGRAGPNPLAPRFSFRTRLGSMFDADIDGSPSTISRLDAVGEFDLVVPMDERLSLTFGLSAGVADYDFDGPSALALGAPVDPWDRILSNGVSFGFRYAYSQREFVFGSVNINSDGETDSDFEDTITGGLVGGYAYAFDENLTLGFGAIAQTRLEDDPIFIPFPVVFWKPPVGEERRWSVGVGSAAGGPTNAAGFLVSYEATDTLSLSTGIGLTGIAGDFRLDDSGTAPGGVGRESSVPVILGLEWKPARGLSVSGYAGMTLLHEFEVLDQAGNSLIKRDADPAPVVGVSISVKF